MNNITNHHQSAYKKHHSTETAMLKIQNDILQAVDRQGGAIVVLLDLSAAFDTIDHRVLLQTLQRDLGVTGTTLDWFASYLSGRRQTVRIGSTLSDETGLPYGVPQGFVLGPLLFSVYTSPLSQVISDMDFHLYADNSTLYIAFNPRSANSINTSLASIHQCTSRIGHWMSNNFLKLNSDKTEVLVITPPSLSSHGISSLQICDSNIIVADNLGVTLDSAFNLEQHVRLMCKRAYHQIFLIRKIRSYITEDSASTLIQANVTSILDYCNSLLYGLPDLLMNLLQ